MTYIENPKTRGSGIVCCIPQKGRCPRGCPDCFYQGGRSYLEPLEEKTPNMPSKGEARGRIVRVNNGNDSNNDRELVLRKTAHFDDKFYNTSCPDDLEGYDAPVVLTVNPGEITDDDFHTVFYPAPVQKNLMFVRVRTNTWNLDVVDRAVTWFTEVGVPVVLTFIAYWQSERFIKRSPYSAYYQFRRRTTNSYWVITTRAWRRVMARYEDNPLVHSCGSEGITTACRHCGNCLREYYATMERMRAG